MSPQKSGKANGWTAKRRRDQQEERERRVAEMMKRSTEQQARQGRGSEVRSMKQRSA